MRLLWLCFLSRLRSFAGVPPLCVPTHTLVAGLLRWLTGLSALRERSLVPFPCPISLRFVPVFVGLCSVLCLLPLGSQPALLHSDRPVPSSAACAHWCARFLCYISIFPWIASGFLIFRVIVRCVWCFPFYLCFSCCLCLMLVPGLL